MITLLDIVVAVAQEHGLTSEDIVGPSRVRQHVIPRQIVIGLARDMTTLSLPQIGRRLGGRDHTTVLYSLRRYDAVIYDEHREAVERIRTALYEQEPERIMFKTCRKGVTDQ